MHVSNDARLHSPALVHLTWSPEYSIHFSSFASKDKDTAAIIPQVTVAI
jgi:hypothetical protein